MQDTKKKRVLILDGAIWTGAYRPTEGWAQFMPGVEVVGVGLPAGDPVPSLEGFTHLLVTGSEASIVEPQPWYEVEAETIRRAADRGLPILASCFGHQMLAAALSGQEHVRRSPTPEVGWIELELVADDPLLAEVPRRPWCFASHFDEVLAPPPPPWRVLARSAGCGVQVMRWGERPVWGIQAHPEITPPEARDLLAAALEKMPDQADLFRSALAAEPRDDAFAGVLTANFLACRG